MRLRVRDIRTHFVRFRIETEGCKTLLPNALPIPHTFGAETSRASSL